ncbi:hypothetical protein VTK26DRAFT_6569 [Humicola hyalothermophila]
MLASRINEVVAQRNSRPIKKLSLLGIPPEIRLIIYGYALATRGPADKILIAANRAKILGDGDLTAAADDPREYYKILAYITDRLYEWDSRTVFLVCRQIYLEAMPVFYKENTFELFSPYHGINWITNLNPHVASLIRSVSLPLSLVDPTDGLQLMVTVNQHLPNIQTLYVARAVTRTAHDPDTAAISAMHDPDPNYVDGVVSWKDWMYLWDSGDNEHHCDPNPLGGPFRKVVAAASSQDEDRDGGGDTPGPGQRQRQSWAVRASESDPDRGGCYLLVGMSMLPRLRAVYLNDAFSPMRDAAVARVLRGLARERREGQAPWERKLSGVWCLAAGKGRVSDPSD